MNIAKIINGKIKSRKLKRHVAMLVKACEAEDMTAFKKLGLQSGAAPVSDTAIEVAFHKTRLELTPVSRDKRVHSAQWLRDRGCTSMDGRNPLDVIGGQA